MDGYIVNLKLHCGNQSAFVWRSFQFVCRAQASPSLHHAMRHHSFFFTDRPHIQTTSFPSFIHHSLIKNHNMRSNFALAFTNFLASIIIAKAFTPASSSLALRILTHSGSTLNFSANNDELDKAPTFNGQIVFPTTTLMKGLQNHKVAAVYAVQSSKTKANEWKEIKHISITKDLLSDLESLTSTYGSSQIGYVKALSFAYPQKSAMMETANRWAGMVMEEGGSLGLVQQTERTQEEKDELVRLMMETAEYDDDDDDDDEFEFDDDEPAPLFVDKTNENSAAAEEVVSPFSGDEAVVEMPEYSSTSETNLEFNLENVDKVLDEIRPYLISDGGNVSIDRVDVETRSVYLVLEGACGSCASSTVTMQMGIERVLKENFENMGEVAQVEPPEDELQDTNELTMEAVQREVNRISPAITAMGGVVEIVSVDPLGVVELRFRGANKVQQGLELALRDVKYVKHVKFVN